MAPFIACSGHLTHKGSLRITIITVKCLMILLLAFDFAGAGGESGEPRLRQRAVTPAPAMKVRVR